MGSPSPVDGDTHDSWPKCKVEHRDGAIFVGWSSVSLTDDALHSFAIERLPQLLLPEVLQPMRSTKGRALECVVDFSENLLEKAAPLKVVLEQLRQATLHITILKLHRNRFDDDTALVLAEHVKEAAAAGCPLMQLHFSDNKLSATGVRYLVEAAHESGSYPSQAQGSLKSLGIDSLRKALYLRVEKTSCLQRLPYNFAKASEQRVGQSACCV